MTAPIILTNPNQLPAIWTRGIVAPSFDSALAEYERRYGKAGACWQYQQMFYFEARP